MTLDDLVRFSKDLRRHARISNTVRRMGDQVVLKAGDTEFIFRRDGRYLGTGDQPRAALADLVDAMDTACPDLDE